MKKLILLLAFTFSSLLLQGAIPLVKDGKSSYAIVLPDRTTFNGVEKYLLYTANQMRRYIKEGTGAELPFYRESALPAGMNAIYIGNTAKLRKLGVDVNKFAPLTALIRTEGKDIFLAGQDRHLQGAHWADTAANHHLASVRAAVLFMEQYLKYEFLLPGPRGTNIPKVKDINIPEKLNRLIPSTYRQTGGRENELLYDYANCNFGFGSVYHYRGHSYYAAVPRKQFAAKKPEYYILSGGKRDPSVGHLCISNPEVQERIYQEALRRLDAGAAAVQVAQTDGYVHCECVPCQKFGGVSDPGEKLWILHRSFAERLKKERPGKLLQLLAYNPTWEPPKTFDTFPGNVIIELCAYGSADFEKWKKYKGICGFAVYLYNWGEYNHPGLLPKRESRYLAEQAQLFRKYNVTGVYRCGHGELFGLEGPGYYVHAKMLENPDQDWYQLRKHYIDRAFLESAGPMKGFYDLLDARMEAYTLLQGKFLRKNMLPADPRVTICFMFSPELLSSCEMKLKAAKALAVDPKVKARLLLVEKEFAYARSLANALHLYNAYRLSPDQASFDKLGKAVEAHKELVYSYYGKDGKPKKLPGWSDVRFLGEMSRSMLMTNGRLSGEIGAPLNWNIKFLKSKNVLPGAKIRRMDFLRTSKAPAFDFKAPEWSKGEWQSLNHIQLGSLKEQTRFKVLYDEKNLYFGAVTDLPAARKHKVLGHDGSPWLQDSFEILLDPLGTREVHYHFICNPVQNSFYEAALGLIADPLHPRFGKEDVSWNGKWDYQTRRTGNTWELLITIPFASFKQSCPPKGTMWTMNVARQSYYSPKMKWAGEIGLWSPNLENMFISENLAAFGEAYFKE